MGRKTKLTKEKQQRLAELIRAGNYSNQAAVAAGISERTYHRWVARGESVLKEIESWDKAEKAWLEMSPEEQALAPEKKPNELERPSEDDLLYAEFYKVIKQAEAESEAMLVGQIKAASIQSWQAAAWLLERGRTRDRWSRSDRVEVEGQVQHKLGLGASEEELEAARKRLEEARAKEIEPAIDAEAVEIEEEKE